MECRPGIHLLVCMQLPAACWRKNVFLHRCSPSVVPSLLSPAGSSGRERNFYVPAPARAGQDLHFLLLSAFSSCVSQVNVLRPCRPSTLPNICKFSLCFLIQAGSRPNLQGPGLSKCASLDAKQCTPFMSLYSSRERGKEVSSMCF